MATEQLKIIEPDGQNNLAPSEKVCILSLDELRAMIQDAVRAELKPLMEGERRSLLARADNLKRLYES